MFDSSLFPVQQSTEYSLNMKQMVVLFALVACSLAGPAVTSYSFSAVAPMQYDFKHYMPSFYNYKTFPYMATTPYVASPYVASPYVAAPYMAAPVIATAGIKTQYHSQDMMGQAAYGHAEPGQVHHAMQDAAGNKVGSFSHILPDGSVSHNEYVADAMGYRVNSNSLPIHTVAPVAPVADTVEVVAARTAHMAEVEKAKLRSKRDIAYTTASHYPITTSYAAATPYSYSYPHVANYAYSTPYTFGSHYNYHL